MLSICIVKLTRRSKECAEFSTRVHTRNFFCLENSYICIMNFKILKSTEIPKDMRLSVHKTGKLGFSSEAKTQLKLEEYKTVTLAANADDETDKNLYMMLNTDEPDGAYKISKAGDYYYANTGALFTSLGFDYADGNLVVDMRRMQQGETVYYRLSFSKKQTKSTNQKKEEHAES